MDTAETQTPHLPEQAPGLEDLPKLHERLSSLFEVAGFSNDASGGSNRLTGMKDESGSWYLGFKTSIGGYSYHLNFARKTPGINESFHEISLIKPGPWEHQQDRITVIYSDKVKTPKGIYSRGQGQDYLHFAISPAGIEGASITDEAGSYPRVATQTDLDKFRSDFKELNATVEQFLGQSTEETAAEALK